MKISEARRLGKLDAFMKALTRALGGVVINKPQHFGNFTNKFVYGPLENGEV